MCLNVFGNWSGLRVAVVHYWFVNNRGGEKVVESLLRLFPHADVFTHVIDRAKFDALNKKHTVLESFIGRMPRARIHYQKFLPLMPLALEQLDLRDYDLVISSESGPAKGVLTRPEALHICYCHSPMRYLWDMYHEYRESAGWFTRLLMLPFTHYLRLWDQNSANRVDYFVANSEFIRRRIRKVYRRDSAVVHPPVDVAAFELAEEKEDFYLLLGQLTAYKRPDDAITAFAEMPEKRLVVIGQGEMLKSLSAQGLPNVEFLGYQPFTEVRDYLRRARALIFPGVEDFGIVPVEALASGTPVIAYGKGGVLETVTDAMTGIHYHEPSPESLTHAVARFERWEPTIERSKLRESAERFDETWFHKKFEQVLAKAWEEDRQA